MEENWIKPDVGASLRAEIRTLKESLSQFEVCIFYIVRVPCDNAVNKVHCIKELEMVYIQGRSKKEYIDPPRYI